jgi:hypothetical protein
MCARSVPPAPLSSPHGRNSLLVCSACEWQEQGGEDNDEDENRVMMVVSGDSTGGRGRARRRATFPLPERLVFFCVYALPQEIVHSGKSKDRHDIETVLTVLSKDYAMSAQSNFRKGGLIGLAAASLGLGSEACNYLNTLLPPVLACFTDQDPRVRYYACEALYNMAKVSRSSLLGSFNGIFEGLARLCSDIDAGVKNAAHLLDGLLMDIVAESNTFNLESFVPVLSEMQPSPIPTPTLFPFLCPFAGPYPCPRLC